MSMNQNPPGSRDALSLKRPMSVAIYDEYADAAHAVDYLADRQFPVENLAIVGTDLKSVEKVTGNMTWGKVLLGGFLQGAMWAGMFAVIMWMLQPGLSLISALAIGLAGFGLVGMVLAALQYRQRGGERDYTSRTTIIATHYEVLAEADVVDRARHLLSGGSAHQTRSQDLPRPIEPVVPSQADLGALPPPFGQQPAAEPPPFGQQPQPAAPPTPTPPAAQPQQPPAAAPAPVPTPAQPPTPAPPTYGQQTPYGDQPTPYGQYWGEDEPPGIGDIPSSFERPRRTQEDDKPDN